MVILNMSNFPEMPRFNAIHTPNPVVTTVQGETKYLSRSIAVMVVILRQHPETGERWVAVQERGPRVSDSGKRCMVCGYLDYDESVRNAAIREVFEETGLNVEYLVGQGLAEFPPEFGVGSP
jgi:8-oxo-dGTP pyrophosphatase MutT (NUDIX family)